MSTYFVKAGELTKINFDPNRIEEILQNVAVIISTPQMSVPLGRSVGLRMQFVDKPMNVAQAMAVAEINEAIEDQEPRVTVKRVTFELDENAPGKLIPIVEVEINDE